MEEEVKEEQVEQTEPNQEQPKQEEPKVEAKVEEQPQELTDDEKYAKIQTEKLLKKKKTRRIVTFCGMCVAFALALVLIILAAVPVSLKPNCLSDGYWEIKMFHGSSVAEATLHESDEKYAEFMGVYNDAFKQTYLTAIFSGSLFDYQIEEDKEQVSTVLGERGNLVGSGKYFVRLEYANGEEKTLTTQNGKAYKSRYWANATTKWDGTLQFSQVYLVVSDTDGVSDTTIYIVSSIPSSSATSGQREVLIKITVRADTSKIYKAWDSLTTEE